MAINNCLYIARNGNQKSMIIRRDNSVVSCIIITNIFIYISIEVMIFRTRIRASHQRLRIGSLIISLYSLESGFKSFIVNPQFCPHSVPTERINYSRILFIPRFRHFPDFIVTRGHKLCFNLSIPSLYASHNYFIDTNHA